MPPRKQPFSSAKKKQQLQEKRSKKKEKGDSRFDWSDNSTKITSSKGDEPINAKSAEVIDDLKIIDTENNEGQDGVLPVAHIIDEVSMVTSNYALRTVFDKESREEMDKNVNISRKPLQRLSGKQLAHDIKLIDQQYKSLPMPMRPAWDYGMQKEEIEENERKYFEEYLAKIYSTYPLQRLNHFEHNVEVWRQLWRVVEMSDVLLLIADIRHPLFHFPTSLYEYVAVQLKKPLLFVLNKADLVPKEIQDAWISWFKKNYPLLHVVPFATYALDKKELEKPKKKDDKKVNRAKRTKYMDINLIHQFWDEAKKLGLEQRVPDINAQIDEVVKHAEEQCRALAEKRKLNEVKHKSKSNITLNDSDYEDEEEEEETKPEEKIHNEENKESKTKVTTFGFIGHPNVGKSSILNGLVGKTVVSTSYTPGHTKHFQTIPISKHIMLCDCPGLVFPAVDMPKQLQVLCGIFPISQLREPYSSVQYLAERIEVEKYYRLKVPEGYEEWSAWAICEAYAEKRGYFTPKVARPDVYRAANEILRDVLYGRILLVFLPPSETKEQQELQIPSPADLEEAAEMKKKKEKKKKKKKNIVGPPSEDENDNGEVTTVLNDDHEVAADTNNEIENGDNEHTSNGNKKKGKKAKPSKHSDSDEEIEAQIKPKKKGPKKQQK